MDIKEAIGKNEDNDYILSAKNHSVLYKESLPELSSLLDDSEIKHIVDQYHNYDEKAISIQKKYKKLSHYARLFSFLATLFTVLLTVSGSIGESDISFLSDWNPKILILSSTYLAIIFTAAATTVIMMIKNRKLLEEWMEARSEAEEMRVSYFDMLADKVSGATVNEHIQVLEYFRRYQIEVQLNYYSVKSKQLSKIANKAINTIAILAGVILVINAFAGNMGIEWAPFASLAIIVQAYSFMISNKELNDQNARNSERYGRTEKVIAALKAKIDKVRIAINQGDLVTLSTYIKAVQEPLSIENKQWLKSMKSSTMAIQELEKHIDGIDDQNG